MSVSKHITLKEATKSNTASRYGIENNPNREELEAMQLIAEMVFEPLREHFDKTIGISSFFRCVELNDKIGGVSTSQHCKGEAMDIDADIYGEITNKEIFDYIKDNLTFDQLIWEFGDDNEPNWIHVSYSRYSLRKQVFRSVKVGKKTEYEVY